MNELQDYFKDSLGKKACLIIFLLFLLSIAQYFVQYKSGSMFTALFIRFSCLMFSYQALMLFLYYKTFREITGDNVGQFIKRFVFSTYASYGHLMREVAPKLRLALWAFGASVLIPIFIGFIAMLVAVFTA